MKQRSYWICVTCHDVVCSGAFNEPEEHTCEKCKRLCVGPFVYFEDAPKKEGGE